MDYKRFEETINSHPRPLVVDFWAGWCMPCRAMEPALKRVEKEFAGRVDVLRIDADQSTEVLKSLRVYGIPTIIAYHQGKEILRQSGAQNDAGLRRIFEAALAGQALGPKPLSFLDRTVRLVTGIGLIGLGLTLNAGWIWILLGAVVCFMAVYDRCPIWRALTSRLKQRKPA
ncbi:MAG: hypothetical protein Kow0088_08010 [Anaerolineales bacterium]